MPSCGDDKEKDEPIQTENLIGLWKVVSSMDDSYWGNVQLEFFSNGFLNFIAEEYDEIVPCKYYTTGNILHIDFGYGADGYVDEIFEGVYEINGDTMIFNLHTWSGDNPGEVVVDKLILKRI